MRDQHLSYIFKVAVFGILALVAGYVLALFRFPNTGAGSEAIVAVLGPIATVIGTLAGYVAGHNAGGSGTEQAERRAEEALRQARADLQAAQQDAQRYEVLADRDRDLAERRRERLAAVQALAADQPRRG